MKEIAKLIDIEAQKITGQNNICYEEFAAIAAMQWVNATISGYRQSTASELGNYLRYDGNVAEKSWHFSSGYCGSKAYAMMEILKFLDINTREVQFWHINNGSDSHIAIEVNYSNYWHYYDPTWGMFFRKGNNILAIEEILSLPKKDAYKFLVMNFSNIQNSVAEFKTSIYNPLETTFDLGYAGNATIKFDFDHLMTLTGSPAYIGISSNWNKELSEIKYSYLIKSNIEKIEMKYNTSSTSLESLSIKDQNGNLYDTITITNNPIITLNISELKFPANNYLILEALNKKSNNLLFVEKIIVYYKNGLVKEIQ